MYIYYILVARALEPLTLSEPRRGGVELTLIKTLLSLRSTSVIESLFDRDMMNYFNLVCCREL
jgi:hypothetical protein